MARRILLVSMPFNIGIGGFRRSYFVLPYLSKELHNEEFEVELYIPASAIRTALKFFTYELCDKKAISLPNCLEEAQNKVLETLADLERKSHYNFYINEKVLGKILTLSTRLLASGQTNIEKGKTSFTQLIIEKNREVLKPIFERIAWDQVKQYYSFNNNEELMVYSQHETVDALTIASFLSRDAKGVILLMQSDIKGLVAKNIIHNVKSKILGVLAVSPQPIIESPFISNTTRNIRVLIPALALDPSIFMTSKTKSEVEPYSVIYFGRLSKEKGFADLLHAWSLISRREPKARLTLIGVPDNHEIYVALSKYIAKESIRYLAYLPPEKLYQEVSKHNVLIYPSYRDSFSLTVLEALALGLRVVAYDIPVVRYFYRSSNMVYVVKKGDVELFATSIINAFQEKKEPDDYTKALIKMHSSWERVIQAEFNALISVMSHQIM